MENNNNNDNLFTSMFGIESEEEPVVEQPKVEQPVQPAQPLMQEPTMNDNFAPQPMMQNSLQQNTFEQPSFNQTQLDPILEQTVQEEIIVLDSNTPAQPQEQSAPVVDLNQINPGLNTSINSYQPTEEFQGFDEGNSSYKQIYVAFGVILAIIIIGFPLYSVVDNILNPVPNANVGNGTDNESEKPTTTVTEKEPEKPKVESAPIIFDTTLSFDKGYTSNDNELYQTIAFKPTATEGVIKCEHIKSYKTSTSTEKGIVYIYYKDSRAKKVIMSNNQQYTSVSTYKQGLAAFTALNKEVSGNKNTELTVRTSEKDRLIQANLLIDMAYGKTIKLDGTNLNFYVVFSYDAPINDAMNKLLNHTTNKGNMACSTIVSNDASV